MVDVFALLFGGLVAWEFWDWLMSVSKLEDEENKTNPKSS